MSLLSLVVCAWGAPGTVRALDDTAANNDAPRILINEISPASKQSASDEYIVLYNAGPEPVDVARWQLQYRSASHIPGDEKGWIVKAILGCSETSEATCQHSGEAIIDPGKTLRLGTAQGEAMPLTSGMATTGGQVRLLGASQEGAATLGKVYDLVGYGTAKTFEGAAALAPKAGQSIVRVAVSGVPQDTNDNAKDFELTAIESGTTPEDSEISGGVDRTYLAPVITELLPDPVSPQTDSDDEFIELYNPFDEAIDLDGYALVMGSDWGRTFVIEDITLEAQGYVTIKASEASISLSNSGTGVRLLDPEGVTIFEVPSYGKALAGNSWVQKGDGQWGWSSEPTPGAANRIVEPPAKAVTATASKKAASTSKAKSTAAKSSSKKAAAPKSSAKKCCESTRRGSGNSQSDGANELYDSSCCGCGGWWICCI